MSSALEGYVNSILLSKEKFLFTGLVILVHAREEVHILRFLTEYTMTPETVGVWGWDE